MLVSSRNFHCFSVRNVRALTNFDLFLTVTLDFHKWPFVMIISHPQIINFRNFGTFEVLLRKRKRDGLDTKSQTDEGTRWFLYIPKNLVYVGILYQNNITFNITVLALCASNFKVTHVLFAGARIMTFSSIMWITAHSAAVKPIIAHRTFYLSKIHFF